MNLSEISNLKDGWCNGIGVSYDKKQIDKIYSTLFEKYLKNLPPPQIIPTPDGNLLFSWEDTIQSPTIDYNVRTNLLYFHMFDQNNEDFEIECNIRDKPQLKKIHECLLEVL